MKKVPQHIERIARAIATAHGAQIVLNKDGQNLTVAALSGHGSFGWSPQKFADARWMEYVGAAFAAIEIPPPIPAHAAGATIQHNDHLGSYRTVAEQETDMPEWFDGAWVSEESRQFALEHNELWSVQWYPRSPVGFENVCAGRWADIMAHFMMEEVK